MPVVKEYERYLCTMKGYRFVPMNFKMWFSWYSHTPLTRLWKD